MYVCTSVFISPLDGDLYEDGMALNNGFFRTRRFARAGSDYSADLFGDERGLDPVEEMGEGEENSQLEAKRRKDRLEKEEFIRQCTVCGLRCVLSLLIFISLLLLLFPLNRAIVY